MLVERSNPVFIRICCFLLLHVLQKMLESCSVFESDAIRPIREADKCEVSLAFKDGFVKVVGGAVALWLVYLSPDRAV